MADAGLAPSRLCRKCGAAVSGAFCTQCGAAAQEQAAPVVVRSLLPEAGRCLRAALDPALPAYDGPWQPAAAAAVVVALVQGLAWWLLCSGLGTVLSRVYTGLLQAAGSPDTVHTTATGQLVLYGAIFSLAVAAGVVVVHRPAGGAQSPAASVGEAVAVQAPAVLASLAVALLARLWAPLGGVFLLLPAFLFAARLRRSVEVPDGLTWRTIGFYAATALVLGLGQVWWLHNFGLGIL